ncbi:hypothetical protein ACJJTC_010466 [Scirpophaga incertulas]
MQTNVRQTKTGRKTIVAAAALLDVFIISQREQKTGLPVAATSPFQSLRLDSRHTDGGNERHWHSPTYKYCSTDKCNRALHRVQPSTGARAQPGATPARLHSLLVSQRRELNYYATSNCIAAGK